MSRIVIGAGPDALRAAAVLSRLGERVLLLQEGEGVGGVAHSIVPLGTGYVVDRPSIRDDAEEVLGALVESPETARAVVGPEGLVRLPWRRRDVPKLLSPAALLPFAVGWAQSRQREARDARTYEDRVSGWFGRGARPLVEAYARARFGGAPSELDAEVALLHHTFGPRVPVQVLGGGHDEAMDLARGHIERAGGEIRSGVRVTELRTRRGRVVELVVDGLVEAVEQPVWIARSPATVASWLDVRDDLGRDASALTAMDALQVTLHADVYYLPEEIHVLVPGMPFFRVFRAYGIEKAAVFHTVVPKDLPTPSDHIDSVVAAAAKAGLGDFVREGARVQRVAEWHPRRQVGFRERWTRVRAAFDAMGIVLAGRSGLMVPWEPVEEIDAALCLHAGRELTLPAPGQSSFRRFVAR